MRTHVLLYSERVWRWSRCIKPLVNDFWCVLFLLSCQDFIHRWVYVEFRRLRLCGFEFREQLASPASHFCMSYADISSPELVDRYGVALIVWCDKLLVIGVIAMGDDLELGTRAIFEPAR